MNSLESLLDYLIADEIQRIQKLSHEDLVRELIEIKTSQIETQQQ